MTQDNQADQARKGLVDSVKGKAKEIAGAITGNDSLTAEGQLQQAQAQERKEANAVQAVADAQAAQARAEATEAKAKGAVERSVVGIQTAAVENSVRTQQAARKRAAEQAGAREVAQETAQAELDAQRDIERVKVQERVELGVAAKDVVDAVAEHQNSVQAASDTQAEAERMRRHADKLTNDADQP